MEWGSLGLPLLKEIEGEWLKTYEDRPPEHRRIILEQLKYAMSEEPPAADRIGKLIIDEMMLALLNKKSIEQACKDIKQQTDEILSTW